MHSSDVDEVLALADRTLVVARGRIQELAGTPVARSGRRRDAGGPAMIDAPACARPEAATCCRYSPAIALGLALLASFLLLAGFHVVPAMTALWQGSFGSWYAFTSATLVRSTPLIVLGLAFTVGSKAGAINVGMEGQFAAGAIAATWVGLHVGGSAGDDRDRAGPRRRAGSAGRHGSRFR